MMKDKMTEVLNPTTQSEEKIHSWRRCSKGKHFVKTHLVHVPSSKKHPNGTTTTRHEHCATNPTRKVKPKGEVIVKDLLSFDEISYISDKYFADLSEIPSVNALVFKDSSKFDHYICGWVSYWNDIFEPDELLDPNLIKALIATESSFKVDPGRTKARGLMQVLPSVFAILKNPNGELKDHLINLDKAHYLDPSANICAGVRWLFRMRTIASSRLKREATWREAVAMYKGYFTDMVSGKDPCPTGMEKLDKYYSELNGEN